MKALLVAFLAMSSSAYALSPRSSWNDIFSSHEAILKTAYDRHLGDITLDNACYAGTEIRSIAPVRVCLKTEFVPYYEEGGPIYEERCVQTGKSDRSVTTTYAQTVVPQTIRVRVWESFNEADTFPGFEKDYTLPSCK
jgi:hypothetical protein